MKKTYMTPSLNVIDPRYNSVMIVTSVGNEGEAGEEEGGDAKEDNLLFYWYNEDDASDAEW